MIMINNEWEQVEDINDIVRICSENISYEFSKTVESVMTTLENEYKYQIEFLEDEIQDLEDEITALNEDVLYWQEAYHNK